MGRGHEGRVSAARVGLWPEQQTHFYLCLFQNDQGVYLLFIKVEKWGIGNSHKLFCVALSFVHNVGTMLTVDCIIAVIINAACVVEEVMNSSRHNVAISRSCGSGYWSSCSL